MSGKNWYVNYKGYSISVSADYSRSSMTNSISVNGIQIKKAVNDCMYCSVMIAAYSFDNTEREIEVRFAQKNRNSWTSPMGCQIFVDGVFVGGDKHIDYPTVQQVAPKIEKGFISYYLSSIKNFTIPFLVFIIITYRYSATELKQDTLNLLLIGYGLTPILISFVFVLMGWSQLNLVFKNLQRFERKWNGH